MTTVIDENSFERYLRELRNLEKLKIKRDFPIWTESESNPIFTEVCEKDMLPFKVIFQSDDPDFIIQATSEIYKFPDLLNKNLQEGDYYVADGKYLPTNDNDPKNKYSIAWYIKNRDCRIFPSWYPRFSEEYVANAWKQIRGGESKELIPINLADYCWEPFNFFEELWCSYVRLFIQRKISNVNFGKPKKDKKRGYFGKEKSEQRKIWELRKFEISRDRVTYSLEAQCLNEKGRKGVFYGDKKLSFSSFEAMSDSERTAEEMANYIVQILNVGE